MVCTEFLDMVSCQRSVATMSTTHRFGDMTIFDVILMQIVLTGVGGVKMFSTGASDVTRECPQGRQPPQSAADGHVYGARANRSGLHKY